MESKNEQLILETLMSVKEDMGEIKNIAKDLGERLDLHDLQMKEFLQWKIMAGPQLERIIDIEKWKKETAGPAIERLCKTNGFVDRNKDRFVAGIVGGVATFIVANIGNLIEALKHLFSKGG